MLYPINEIFYSIQGEGRNTGMPAWFIRFAGCNLKCPWCDTDYTKKIEVGEQQILNTLKSNSCQNVILTGGEPTIQNLKPLLTLLRRSHFVAIETNGTNDLIQYAGLIDWVTVSPKSLPIAIKYNIDEIKLVWPSTLNLKKVEEIPADYYYLQPKKEKGGIQLNTHHTIKVVLENLKWRLSLQIQKIIRFK